MTFVLTPVDRSMLGEDVRYLERGCTTCKKFSRGMENQTFIEKTFFSKGHNPTLSFADLIMVTKLLDMFIHMR